MQPSRQDPPFGLEPLTRCFWLGGKRGTSHTRFDRKSSIYKICSNINPSHHFKCLKIDAGICVWQSITDDSG